MQSNNANTNGNKQSFSTPFWVWIMEEGYDKPFYVANSDESPAELRELFNAMKTKNHKAGNPETVGVGSEINLEGKRYKVVGFEMYIDAKGEDYNSFHTVVIVVEV